MKRKTKERIRKFFIFLLGAIIVCVLIWIITINFGYGLIFLSDETNYNIHYSYIIDKSEKLSVEYQNDNYVLNISDKCKDEKNKVECVNLNTQFKRNDRNVTFLGFNVNDILSSEELFNNGGVCRDFVVYRKAILNNLGLDSFFWIKYDFTHITLLVEENNLLYELDNNYLYCYNYLESNDIMGGLI